MLADYQSFNDSSLMSTATLNASVVGLVGDNHDAPVAYLKIATRRQVRISCVIRDASSYNAVEYPSVGWIFKKGADTETPVPLLPATSITLDPGEYYFYPETSRYDSPVVITPVIGQG